MSKTIIEIKYGMVIKVRTTDRTMTCEIIDHDADETTPCVPELMSSNEPTTEISVVWCDADVKEKAEEMGIKLTPEQIGEVLDYVERHQDAEFGVTWDTIESAIEELLSL